LPGGLVSSFAMSTPFTGLLAPLTPKREQRLKLTKLFQEKEKSLFPLLTPKREKQAELTKKSQKKIFYFSSSLCRSFLFWGLKGGKDLPYPITKGGRACGN